MQSRPSIDPHAAGPATVQGAAATVAAPEGAPALPPRVSWGAIIAGAVVALTIGQHATSHGTASTLGIDLLLGGIAHHLAGPR